MHIQAVSKSMQEIQHSWCSLIRRISKFLENRLVCRCLIMIGFQFLMYELEIVGSRNCTLSHEILYLGDISEARKYDPKKSSHKKT